MSVIYVDLCVNKYLHPNHNDCSESHLILLVSNRGSLEGCISVYSIINRSITAVVALATGTNTIFLDRPYKIQEDGHYHKSGNFRCKNIFVVNGGYKN